MYIQVYIHVHGTFSCIALSRMLPFGPDNFWCMHIYTCIPVYMYLSADDLRTAVGQMAGGQSTDGWQTNGGRWTGLCLLLFRALLQRQCASIAHQQIIYICIRIGIYIYTYIPEFRARHRRAIKISEQRWF